MLKIRHIIISMIILLAFILASVLFINLFVLASTSDQRYTRIDDLSEYEVALVLGTSSTPNGIHYNKYFYERLVTASKLYHKNKIKHFILSGDNHRQGYNEPEDMKKLLVELGVPKKSITLDYAGFRTLDSVVRAKKVFGQDKFCIVSQSFHIPRALYIANANGIEARGIEARTTTQASRHRYVVLREIFARCKAFLDIYIFDVNPKYLGEPVKLEIS